MRHSIDRLPDASTASSGLDDSRIVELLARHGRNTILPDAPSGWLPLLRSSLVDPMLWFLVVAAVLFWWLGDRFEAGLLLAATIPILGMDAYLHGRTQASTAGLAARLASEATVVRSGQRRRIAAAELVPGDLVIVPQGAYVPADGVVLAGDALQVDESALTGESLPQRKRPLPHPWTNHEVPNVHWLSAGTRLLTGEASLHLVRTGAGTLYGEIARSAQSSLQQSTPLQQAIRRLVAMLLLAAVILCLVLAAARLVQGFGWTDALLSAITLAVAAIPEEFPVVFTAFLGVGVYRLARRRALVRRAAVVENIGRVSCICTDKTGTLTEGRLQLQHLVPAAAASEQALLHAAAIASHDEATDPMDRAIVQRHGPIGDVEIFAFTEARRRQVGITNEHGMRLAAVKGAPETVLAMCEGIDASERRHWAGQAAMLADQGHKVIACASRSLPAGFAGEPESGFVFLGLLGFEDPVRDGVADAIAMARAAGIRVIMVTGDHPGTARAVASEIGLGGAAPVVVQGSELEADFDGPRPDVVARCLPAQKLALVQSLQRAGEIVAVTGDGINDVPALRGADVGIAMGQRGTRAARDAAAIVLLDDELGSILHAIAEGRQLFENLRRSFAFLLIAHIPLVLTAALIPLAGYPLPYLPITIVWLELIIHPAALLAFQHRADADRLLPLQRAAGLRFFDPAGRAVIVIGGGAATLAIFASFAWHHADGAAIGHTRAAALAILVGVIVGTVAGLGRLRTSAARWLVLIASGATLIAMQTPSLAALLHLGPLTGVDAAVAAGCAALAALCGWGYEGRSGRQRTNETFTFD